MIALKGAPVAKALNEASAERVRALALAGVSPKLFIVRVGEDPSDSAYVRGISKSAAASGVAVELARCEESVPEEELRRLVGDLSADPEVHGILVLRPLPPAISEDAVALCIDPAKDVDAMNPLTLGRLFRGDLGTFAPATARAVLELLDHYGYDVRGRKGCVLGRSAVVGRPLQALLTARDATVTLCHSKTKAIEEHCRQSEFVVACVGVPGFLTPNMVSPGAWVVDVGINVSEDGKLVGDVDPLVARVAEAMSPVPGGVGSVTAATLIAQVVRAAEHAHHAG